MHKKQILTDAMVRNQINIMFCILYIGGHPKTEMTLLGCVVAPLRCTKVIIQYAIRTILDTVVAVRPDIVDPVINTVIVQLVKTLEIIRK